MKEYRISWIGWYGGRGYNLQIKRKWWVFSWWETIDTFMSYEQAEEEYEKLIK